MEQFAFPLARDTDPPTSHAAAVSFRRDSQRHLLLLAYGRARGGLTDEEASIDAGVHQGWKRCSDLRNQDLIADTGQTRKSSAGADQMVCGITFFGKRALGLLDAPKEAT